MKLADYDLLKNLHFLRKNIKKLLQFLKEKKFSSKKRGKGIYLKFFKKKIRKTCNFSGVIMVR